jgi:hypothetical protein
MGIYNPLPFDRRIALLMNRFGDAGAFFRRSTFSSTGVRYDPIAISYEDWALWMDLNRLGIRGETLPFNCYRYRVRADAMMNELGWPNHTAVVGHLVTAHFPALDDAEREVLVTLVQTWGGPAYEAERRQTAQAKAQEKAAQAGTAQQTAAPQPAAPPLAVAQAPAASQNHREPAEKPLRHVVADKLVGATNRVPGLTSALSVLGRSLVKAADRMRGRRPPR